jgi:hypothetical protein
MNLRILVCLIAFGTFLSCDNELVLTEKGSVIPITYAIFDKSDTAHYVRVEKAFIDEKISAIELARDSKNLYFDKIQVSLRNIGKNIVYNFTKVDGNLEGYKRDSGAFATQPNTLYKLKKADLDTLNDFELKITIEDSIMYTGKTKIVQAAFLVKPSQNTSIDFDDVLNIRYSWNPGLNSINHSMVLKIKIGESFNSEPFKEKILTWNLFSNVSAERYEFNGKEFYTLLANNLTVSPNIKRVMSGVDVVFTSGGKSLSDYITVGQANLGITSSGEVPVFTNLTRGRGVVGSRAKVEYKNLPVSRNTTDRLKNNELTKSLNFQ